MKGARRHAPTDEDKKVCDGVTAGLVSAELHEESEENLIFKLWLLCGKRAFIIRALQEAVCLRQNTSTTNFPWGLF